MRQESLITIPKCKVSMTGAEFDPGITFDEWASVGKKLIRISECVQWTIGDWLNFGRGNYRDARSGEERNPHSSRYKILIECLPYEENTLYQYAWVAWKVKSSTRVEQLSHKHHEAVAKLCTKKQKLYLDAAIEGRLTVSQLRKLIDDSEAVEKTKDENMQLEPSPYRWSLDLQLFISANIGKFPASVRAQWKAHLKPLVELYERL